MSPTPNVPTNATTGPSVQLTTDAVIANYIHEISERHRRRDEGPEELASQPDCD